MLLMKVFSNDAISCILSELNVMSVQLYKLLSFNSLILLKNSASMSLVSRLVTGSVNIKEFSGSLHKITPKIVYLSDE